MEKVVGSGIQLPARIERKYWYPSSSASDISLILSGLLPIRRQHPDRYVNNVYFDTPGLEFLRDNIQGIGRRLKIRFRWYGDFDVDTIANGAIEAKVRRFGLVTKTVSAIDSVHRLDALECVQVQLASPAWLATVGNLGLLEPVLANRYRRRYFVSFDGCVRLTVDSEVGFMESCNDIGHSRDMRFLSGETVVESKYSVQDSLLGDNFLAPFSTRASRHSKYVRGMRLLY